MEVTYKENADKNDGTGAVSVESGTYSLGETFEVTEEEYASLSSRLVLETSGNPAAVSAPQPSSSSRSTTKEEE